MNIKTLKNLPSSRKIEMEIAMHDKGTQRGGGENRVVLAP